MLNRLKADKDLVKEVYSAAKRFKMERVKQVCYLCALNQKQCYNPGRAWIRALTLSFKMQRE